MFWWWLIRLLFLLEHLFLVGLLLLLVELLRVTTLAAVQGLSGPLLVARRQRHPLYKGRDPSPKAAVVGVICN